MPLTPSRRSFLVSGSMTLAALTLPRMQAQAGDHVAAMRAAGAHAKITTQELRGGLRVLLGSGGNIAVLAQGNELLLVDSGLKTSEAQIVEALAAIKPKPPTQLINTHWHFDHTDGNEWVHAKGAVITAHRNTLERLSTTQHLAFFNAVLAPALAGALPTETFVTESRKRVSSVGLALRHYEPAHTDSDISVHFEEPDVLHVGDTWFNGLYPFIDYSSGGGIDGLIRAAELNLRIASASTIVIPGHGAVGNREQLQQFGEMLSGIREKVASGKRQGKTLDEIVATKPTAAYDGRFSAAVVPTPAFVGLVYQGV